MSDISAQLVDSTYNRNGAAQRRDGRGTAEALELVKAGGLLGGSGALKGGDTDDVFLAALQSLVHAGGASSVVGALLEQRAGGSGQGAKGEEDDVAGVHGGICTSIEKSVKGGI